MKNKILPLILLSAILVYSCRDELDEIDIITHDPRLIRIKVADRPFYEYSYTSADIVTEEKTLYNFTNYGYNELAQLVTVDYYSDFALINEDKKVLDNALNNKELMNIASSEKGGVLKYKYDDFGELKNSYFFQSSLSSNEYSEFTYDDDGRIARQALYYDNKIAGHIDYSYDLEGNLIKESLYSIASDGSPELSTTTQYEFDNYKNPFKSINKQLIPGINTNTNNIVRETFTIHFKPDEGTDIERITVNSYEYNSRGYPVKKNGNIEYIYE